MTPYSASTLERLASELEAADRDLPDAKWEVWTSNSFRRITGPDARDGGVLHAVVQRDGQPDLSMNEEKLRQLSWLRNSAPEVTAALRSAVAEVERLRALVVEASLPFGLRRLYEHVFNDAGVSEADETRIIADMRERTAKGQSK